MSFDYRKEYAQFMTEWEKQEKVMRAEGMDEAAIFELYNLYFEQFKADRNYSLHKCDFTKVDDKKVLSGEKVKNQGMVTQPTEFEKCFDLLEQIDNPVLLKALKSLSLEDYKLFCLHVLMEFSQVEIAEQRQQTKQNINYKMNRIKNNLKKFF